MTESSTSAKSAGPAKINTGGLLWHVPKTRNEEFIGRDELLKSLAEQLNRPTHATRTIALFGPAGVGKTQLVLEYAYRHRDDYPLVCWIGAQTPEQLDADFAALGRELLGSQEANAPFGHASILRELANRPRWLLIFDGAPSPHAVEQYLPVRYKGHVLITTRDEKWRGVGSAAVVPPFDRSESISFLKSRTGRSGETIVSSGQLAKALNDLPLAMEFAATMIRQADISFGEYLHRYENLWGEMLLGGAGVRDALALAIELSLRQLLQTAPAAGELLTLLSFFHPDGFQRAWLTAGASVLLEPLATTVREFAFLQESLEWLAKFGFIELAGGRISMNENVAAHVRGRLSSSAYNENVHVALRLMDDAFRFDTNDPRTWSEGMAMMPHAAAAIEYSTRAEAPIAASVQLLNQIGQCLFRNGRYEQARSTLDRALSMAYAIYGDGNPRLSAISNNMGRVLLRLGELDGARDQFEWALSLDERTYGPMHPHVAEILNNYGTCLLRLGDLENAVHQFQRALDIYETQCGPSHPGTASIINNIGYAHMKRGDLQEAWGLMQRALGVVHASYGPNHPDVASILLNLGDVLRRQGNHALARAQYQRALLIDEICYGASHPDVARDAVHIGAILMDLGDHAAAKPFFERALMIDEAAYGRQHRYVIARLEDLGRCLKKLDDVDGSAEVFARAAEMRRLLPAGKAAETEDDSSTAAA